MCTIGPWLEAAIALTAIVTIVIAMPTGSVSGEWLHPELGGHHARRTTTSSMSAALAGRGGSTSDRERPQSLQNLPTMVAPQNAQAPTPPWRGRYGVGDTPVEPELSVAGVAGAGTELAFGLSLCTGIPTVCRQVLSRFGPRRGEVIDHPRTRPHSFVTFRLPQWINFSVQRDATDADMAKPDAAALVTGRSSACRHTVDRTFPPQIGCGWRTGMALRRRRPPTPRRRGSRSSIRRRRRRSCRFRLRGTP